MNLIKFFSFTSNAMIVEGDGGAGRRGCAVGAREKWPRSCSWLMQRRRAQKKEGLLSSVGVSVGGGRVGEGKEVSR